MSFAYRQIDEIEEEIEPIGNVQSSYNEDQTFCPSRPLLPQWPFWTGISQILVGFLCLIFGSIELFVIPFMIDIDSDWSLSLSNAYGAPVWSGIMLILAGSTAVRATKFKQILHVQHFYIQTVLSFLCNLSLMILILWALKKDCQTENALKYSTISILSSVSCLIGCLLLHLSFANYLLPVLYGEVHLVRSLVACFLPCVYKQVPSASSSRQSVNSTESNLVV